MGVCENESVRMFVYLSLWNVRVCEYVSISDCVYEFVFFICVFI